MKFKKYFLGLGISLVTFQVSAQKKIVIIGKAVNFKIGPKVISNKTGVSYILDGLDYWDEKIVGKTIKVWGEYKLEKINSEPEEPGLPIPQKLSGKTKKVIIKAKWKLLKK